MTYYTTSKVLDILKNYYFYKQAIESHKQEYASVGVAQGGIESVMPKAQGKTSDVVANEALRQIEGIKVYADMATDIKYIEDRLYRVTGYKTVLGMRLEGRTQREIAKLTRVSESSVGRELVRVAKQMAGEI